MSHLRSILRIPTFTLPSGPPNGDPGGAARARGSGPWARPRRFRPAGACLLTLVLAGSLSALAAGPTPTRYLLDVRFVPTESRMEGSAVIGFAVDAAAEVVFYLHGELRLTSASLSGEAVDFRQESVLYPYDYSLVATKVTVSLAGRNPSGLTLSWEGPFHPSGARSPSDYMRIDGSGVYLRAYGYSPWFPVFLEPDDDETALDFDRVTVTTPRRLTAVFAGTLIDRRRIGQDEVSVWTAHATLPSEVQLTAREFETRQSGRCRVYFLGDARSSAAAGRILRLAEGIERRYRDRYAARAEAGPLHLLQLPRFGDISAGNVVGISDASWTGFEDDPGRVRLLAHELVHPFVQPRVSRSDPLYALAVEGFPSYFHLPVLAEILGEPSYQDFLDGLESAYREKRRSGSSRRGDPLPPEKPLLRIGPDEIGVYKDVFVLDDRACLFLDFLRRRMGADGFFDFARELFARDTLDLPGLRALVLERLPTAAEDLRLWLETTEYPPRLRRSGGGQDEGTGSPPRMPEGDDAPPRPEREGASRHR